MRTRWLEPTRAPTLEKHGCRRYNNPATPHPATLASPYKVGQDCANSCGFFACVSQRTLTKTHLKQTSLVRVSLPQCGIPKRRGATHSTIAWNHMLVNRLWLLQHECHHGCSIRWVVVHTPPGGGKRMKPHHASTQTRMTINEITLVRGESA